MNFTETIIAGIIIGIIVSIISVFINKYLKKKISIKSKSEEENDKKVTTKITVKNKGFLSNNKNPVILHQAGDFIIKDNQQINVFHITGSTAIIMPKDLSVTSYGFSVTGSTSPNISTSTDIIE